MKNLSIKTKLYSTVFLVGTLLVVLVFYLLNSFGQINNSFRELEQENNQLKITQRILIESGELIDSVERFILTRGPKWERKHKEISGYLEEDILELKALVESDEERKLIDQLQSARDNLTGVELLILAKARAGEASQAAQLFDREYENRQLEVTAAIESLIENAERETEALFSQNREVIVSTQRVLSLLTFILISLSALILGVVATTISRQIGSLVQTTLAITGGDLSKRAEVKSKDEIGQLAQSFNQMTDSLLEARKFPENIIKSMLEPLIVVTPEAKIKEINQRTIDLLGYTREELIGQPIEKIFGAAAAAAESISKGIGLEKLIEEGSVQNVEMKLLAKNQEEIPVSISGSVMKDEQNKLIAIVVVAKDMREIQRLQRERVKILEAAREGLERKVKERTIELGAANQQLEASNQQLEAAKTGLEQKVRERTAELEEAKAGLEEEVAKRTAELQQKLLELERFNKIAVGRELKMVELKQEVSRLNNTNANKHEATSDTSQPKIEGAQVAKAVEKVKSASNNE